MTWSFKVKVFYILASSLGFMGCQTLDSGRAYSGVASSDDITSREVAFAKVVFEPKSGSDARGEAWFVKENNGFTVHVRVKNVAPGKHGIHIHEHGDCSAPDASSAGDHFNPTNLPHGSPDPSKFHLGDFGNINIDKDGRGSLALTIPIAKYPAHTGWEEIIGKSFVLHEKEDDLTTQPSGNSGDRIACGIIVKNQ